VGVGWESPGCVLTMWLQCHEDTVSLVVEVRGVICASGINIMGVCPLMHRFVPGIPFYSNFRFLNTLCTTFSAA
jgi:hypothetical protein